MTLYPRRLNITAKEIRVLVLQPGFKDDPINCSLNVVSLGDEPDYEALSYVWGSPEDPVTITVNGNPLLVTQHAAEALNYLRLPEQSRTVWIDSVCINQQDIAERSEQVTLMGEIYRSAKTVLAFLGPSTMVPEMGEEKDEDDNGEDNFDTMYEIAEGGTVSDDRARRLLRYLLFFLIHAVWFSRVWILQEMALAKKEPLICCGRRSIPWDKFFLAWAKAQTYKPWYNLWRQAMTHIKPDMIPLFMNGLARPGILDELRQGIKTGGTKSITELVAASRTAGATDPRDKIYALFSMIPKAENRLIKVDYRKDVGTVYAEAMASAFANGKGLKLLSTTSLSDPASGLSYPSWVPDFANEPDDEEADPNPLPLHPLGVGVSGIKAASEKAIVDSDLKTVRVEGLFVDVIHDVLQFKEFVDDSMEQFQEVEKLVANATERHPPSPRTYLEDFKSKEPLWAMLISNKGKQENEPSPESYGKMYEVYRGRAEVPAELKNMGGEYVDDWAFTPNWQQEYRNRLFGQLPKRAFFTTECGLSGRGMRWIKKGDHVVILLGAPVPFILRPVSDGNYQVVGIAYVGGIMDGGLVNHVLKNGPDTPREFALV